MFDVIGKRRWYYLFSGLIVVPGFIFILLTPLTGGQVGLRFSIDFTGGTLWEVRFADRSVGPADVKSVLVAEGLADSTVVSTSNGYLLIRTKPIGLREVEATPTPAPTVAPTGTASESPSPTATGSGSPTPSGTAGPIASPTPTPTATPTPSPSPTPVPTPTPSPSPTPGIVPTEGKIGDLARALETQLGPIEAVRQQTTVGPVISEELTLQALYLILLGSAGILTWISLRFRDVKMGVTAIGALVHDVIVVVGIFAILGTFLGVQVDALFVTAMLTVIGFSVHDTIVVYDRIRENRARHAGEPFPAIVNHSILQTFGRSINTSMTVLLTLLALLLFGGEAIRFFVLALLIGILSGTYSSIFNASALLVTWHEWEAGRRARRIAARRGA